MCLKFNRFIIINHLLSTPYLYNSKRLFNVERNLLRYTVFRPYLSSIEENRKNRLKFRHVSLTSKILEERIEPKYLELYELIDSDYILYLRSILDTSLKSFDFTSWYPYLLIFSMQSRNLPTFLKATSKEYFKKIALLLGINDKKQLIMKFEEVCKSRVIEKSGISEERHKNLMNIENLDSA